MRNRRMIRMVHRFTIKQLNEWSDDEIIYTILRDRYNSSIGNVYSPFGQKMEKLMQKYYDKVQEQGGFKE
jgi:hypothetical protein